MPAKSDMYVGSSFRAILAADFGKIRPTKGTTMSIKIAGDSGTSVILSREDDGRIRVLVNGTTLGYSIVSYDQLVKGVTAVGKPVEAPKEPKTAPAAEDTGKQIEEPAKTAETPAEPAEEPKPADAPKTRRVRRPVKKATETTEA